jgi:CubicO group peptidase (beta-lactamase class C family)
MVERGKIVLDQPVTEIVPGLPAAWSKVTEYGPGRAIGSPVLAESARAHYPAKPNLEDPGSAAQDMPTEAMILS